MIPILKRSSLSKMSPFRNAMNLPFASLFLRVKKNSDNHALNICSYNKSKSSSLSRYLRIFRLIFEESTHVTKSSIFLVTRKAGSVTTSVPHLKISVSSIYGTNETTVIAYLTCPCSMNFVAAVTLSAI